MTTQTIEVKFETLNLLTTQLRAAKAVIKVAKGNDDVFNISVIRQPTLTTIEEILTRSEPSEISDRTNAQELGLPSESVTVPEIVEDLAVTEDMASTILNSIKLDDAIEEVLKEATSTAKKARKKSTKKLKQEVGILPALVDEDTIPF